MWSFFSRDPIKDFPYDIGEQIDYNSERQIWKLHKGLKKGTNEEVTIFILDGRNASPNEVEIAKSAVKRLKTLRHPNILKFLDSVESDKGVYLAVEKVQPLEKYLENKENLQLDLSISWGLFQVTRALSFLVNDGNLRHNNVHIGSIYVNNAGEWKLGGLEFVSESTNTSVFGKLPSSLHQMDPPEIKSGSKGATKWSQDAWGLGCLIWEVFNASLMQDETVLKNTNKIPKSILSTFNELVCTNSSNRPNPADIIVRGRRPGGFYKNDFVDSLLFLEEIQIKEQNEKTRFFTGLPNFLDKFPDDICRHKILPQLINAFEYGNSGSSVLAPLFKLGKLLDEAEYQQKIVPCVVKLFSSTDRATRVRLLQQLENFAGHLQTNTVNEKIFPNIITGFMDTNPTVREYTVKAMLHLAPKLNYNNLNVELLKHFARIQLRDDQSGIRTNTTICLGKIACHLNPQTRRKVLIPAFTRVFKDTFPQAKIAGILALAATQHYYSLTEVSTLVLPALCSLTSDSDKSVRDNAFKTIKGFLSKLEKASEDPSLREKYEAEIDSTTQNASEIASSWAGWAVQALTSKFNRSQSQQSGIGQNVVPRARGKYPFGNQSSSSTSTTTSSIPSSPSDYLEPTTESTQESTTDYDDENWENENWGSIDDEGNKRVADENKNPSSGETDESNAKPESDGWDNGWDDENVDNKDSNTDDQIRSNPSGSNSNLNPSISWSSINQPSNNQEEFFNNFISSKNTKNSPIKTQNSSDWGSTDSEWTLTNSGSSSPANNPDKRDEMKKRREERKLHRQNEMETKNISSRSSGPLKLGAKKI